MSGKLTLARLSRAVSRRASRLSVFRRLMASDQSGSAIMEFAFAVPIFVLLAVVSLEMVNLKLAKSRVSQITFTVADNLSRAKMSVPLGLPRLREVDVNDTLIGAGAQGGTIMNALTNGRIIVSSLQRNSAGRQTIAWQRCKGKLAVTSSYGVQGTTQPNTGTSGFQGMGRDTDMVKAEPNSAIIFAEVSYDYKPIIAKWLFTTVRLRDEAAFYVRDDRDLVGGPAANGMYNPSPTAIVSACNLYNDTF